MGAEFRGRFLQYFFAAAADVDCGTQLEEASGHGFAESGAAAGDEDALFVEKIVAKHAVLPLVGIEQFGNRVIVQLKT